MLNYNNPLLSREKERQTTKKKKTHDLPCFTQTNTSSGWKIIIARHDRTDVCTTCMFLHGHVTWRAFPFHAEKKSPEKVDKNSFGDEKDVPISFTSLSTHVPRAWDPF